MGTGVLPEPEPRSTEPASAPAGRVVGAGPPPPPPPPLLGFRKAARTPPLSTAAAIITSSRRGAALECRTNAGAVEVSAACCCCCCCSSGLAAPLRRLEMLIGGAEHVAAGLIGGSASPLLGWDIVAINRAPLKPIATLTLHVRDCG